MNPMALLTTPFSQALLGVALASVAGLVIPASSRTPYFFSAGTFFVVTIGLALAGLALHRRPEPPTGSGESGGIPEALVRGVAGEPGSGNSERPVTRMEAVGHAFGLTALATFGYALMELFYGAINLRLGLAVTGSFWAPFFGELDTYILDRSYQYIALLVFFFLLRVALKGSFTSFLTPGDGTRETVILGPEQPMPWRRACLRLTVMLLGLAALGLLARPQVSFDAGRWPAFLGRLLGGTNNSFIEELLFRGLLLPALMVRLSAGPANWIQALLFSVIHWSYVGDGTWQPVQQEAVKLGLYTGIGLLLGRASYESKGIGISTLLHALITASIWMHLTFGGG